MNRILLALTLACLSFGCASSGGGESRDDTPVDGTLVAAYTNIDLALRELRPSWIRRAREVFVDEKFAGDVAILRRSFNERIKSIELVPARDVVRRFGPCQSPDGLGNSLDAGRDPQCGTRPVIHVILFTSR